MHGEDRMRCRVLVLAIVVGAVSPSNALADRIGGSNLPATTPALKGRISDDTSANSVVVLGSNIGATTNAGPTLLEQPSTFIDRAFGYATFRNTGAGRVDFSFTASDRLYTAFDEAYEQSVVGNLALTKDWGGNQQTLVTLGFSKNRDVEERIMETSLTLVHSWNAGTLKPYIKAETAFLNYNDVPDPFQPYANQDDRDRISSRAQVGLRTTLTDHIELEVGAGVDNKHYIQRYDDFGVSRNSLSPFPLIGLAYTAASGSVRALYMPFWRNYRDELFRDTWKHAYAAEADYTISDWIKLFGAARYGFQETDFLIASSAYESVAVAGVTLTLGKTTVTFAASETRRTYDDLDLIAVDRNDKKREIELAAEYPLNKEFSLNGRIAYLGYGSSFGDITTDAMTASLGVTYAATH